MYPRLRAGDQFLYFPINEIVDHGLYVLDRDSMNVIKVSGLDAIALYHEQAPAVRTGSDFKE